MRLPLPSKRERWYRFLLLAFVLLVGSSAAQAQLSSTYCFGVSSGSLYELSSPVTITPGSLDDAATAVYNIGFNFVFNGTTYTQFSVSTNGPVKLGGTAVNSTLTNNPLPTAAGDYPILSAFHDDLYMRPNGIRYSLIGTAPNRVLVIDQNVERYPSGNSEDWTMQVVLFEGSNKIEFRYGAFTVLTTANALSGFIGIAASNTNLMGVNPTGPTIYTSGSVDVLLPEVNTIYTFGTYAVGITGNVAQGGTLAMNSGDNLLTNVMLDPGTSQEFTPFAVSSIACGPANFTYTITGTYAADYTITPGSSSIASGASVAPKLVFRPGGSGLRDAVLTVSDGKSFTRTYNLRGRGSSLAYIGYPAQGGVVNMPSGSDLMVGTRVDRMATGTFTPFTVNNIDGNPAGPGVSLTYRIVGKSGTQYSISPTTVVLGPGQSSTPVLTFRPTGVGVIDDTLIITSSEGTSRRFPLKAISVAAGARFSVNGVELDSTTNLLGNLYACTGSEVVSVPIRVQNIGVGTFRILGLDMFLTDTTIRQGVPEYPFLRNERGQMIPASDYFLTEQPGVAPYEANKFITYPYAIEEGGERTLYLNFLATNPGKRFGRFYLRTNGVTFSNSDTEGLVREGLLRFGVFGRGYGARLAGSVNGGLMKPVVFPETKLGTTSTQTIEIFNSGQCPLRIDLSKLSLTSGDVDEFAIVSLPSSNMIGPGQSDRIVVSFTPRQAGSRRASLRLVTNDSTIQVPGIVERGVRYLDLFGGGGTDLYASGHNFGQALIGGTGNEQKRGIVRIVNTLSAPVTVNNLTITGTDSADFQKGGVWPASTMLQPGQELSLEVIFAPTGGTPGPRSAEVKASLLGSNVTVSAPLAGVAGTRMATANPKAINFPMTTAGKQQRRMVSVTNTGTMPLMLTQPEIIGQGSEYFSVGKMARLELAPGQTEYVELTFAPRDPVSVSVILEFGGNMTNGPVQIEIGGSSKTQNPNDPNIAITGRDGVIENGVGMVEHSEDRSVSGVGSEAASGMSLSQNVPNPGREVVEISYVLAQAGQVELVLYDAQGRLVRQLDGGYRAAGERAVRVDVRDLANGTYFYRLTANGVTLSRSMNVVK